MGAATMDPPATAAGGMTEEERAELDELQERAKGKGGKKASAAEEAEALNPEVPQPESIVVKGQAGKIHDLGGKLPQEAILKLAGGKIEVLQGEGYEKGAMVYFSGCARVTNVSQRDKLDGKTGTAVECKQEHTATVLDLVVDKIVEP